MMKMESKMTAVLTLLKK